MFPKGKGKGHIEVDLCSMIFSQGIFDAAFASEIRISIPCHEISLSSVLTANVEADWKHFWDRGPETSPDGWCINWRYHGDTCVDRRSL